MILNIGGSSKTKAKPKTTPVPAYHPKGAPLIGGNRNSDKPLNIKTTTPTQTYAKAMMQYGQSSTTKPATSKSATTTTTTTKPVTTKPVSGNSGTTKSVTAPATKSTSIAPVTSSSSSNMQAAYMNAITNTPSTPSTPAQTWLDAINSSKSLSGYNGALNGQNTRIDYNGHVIDTSNQDWINEALKNGAKISKSNLGSGLENMNYQQLSMAALQGDTNAQAFLKALSNDGMSGADLWKDQTITKEMFDKYGQAYRARYTADNPYSDITKDYDMNNYNAMSEWIKSGKPIADYQLDSYNNIVSKWNLQDYRDPNIQYQDELKKNEQSALDAQDVALNQGMAQMDANSFQQMQQLQQQMSDRGIGDSGIAADSYMRAQMANNQNYQQAFADSATKKTDIRQSFEDAINQSKLNKQEYDDKRSDAMAQQSIDQQTALAKLQEQQTAQDKFLTSSTGYVYLNGSVLTDSDGNPMRSVDLMKLDETSRHNQTTEDISRMKIQADVQKASDQLQLAYDKLDKDWYVANANIDKAIGQLDIAARNSATKEQSNAITAIKAKISAVKSQVKNGKPTDAQKKTLKDLMGQLDGVVGGK